MTTLLFHDAFLCPYVRTPKSSLSGSKADTHISRIHSAGRGESQCYNSQTYNWDICLASKGPHHTSVRNFSCRSCNCFFASPPQPRWRCLRRFLPLGGPSAPPAADCYHPKTVLGLVDRLSKVRVVKSRIISGAHWFPSPRAKARLK